MKNFFNVQAMKSWVQNAIEISLTKQNKRIDFLQEEISRLREDFIVNSPIRTRYNPTHV